MSEVSTEGLGESLLSEGKMKRLTLLLKRADSAWMVLWDKIGEFDFKEWDRLTCNLNGIARQLGELDGIEDVVVIPQPNLEDAFLEVWALRLNEWNQSEKGLRPSSIMRLMPRETLQSIYGLTP